MASSQGSDAGKTALRAEYVRIRTRIAPAVRATTDARILLRLEGLPAWRESRLVLTYVSFGSEVDTHALIQAAWAAGKQVAVPRCRRSHSLDFYVISSENDLEPGLHGLMEPSPDCGRPLTPPQMVGSMATALATMAATTTGSLRSTLARRSHWCARGSSRETRCQEMSMTYPWTGS